MPWDPRGNLAQSLCVTYEETEAQRDERTYPRLHRVEVADLGLELSSQPPQLPSPLHHREGSQQWSGLIIPALPVLICHS